MRNIIVLFIFLVSGAFAQTFDFNSKGNNEANLILKNYVQNELNIEDAPTIAYFYDINKDNNQDIIGIVKYSLFYSLSGYKLVVLEKKEDNYKAIKCDVFFDNTRELKIDNNKITYFKTIFYNNKKYIAHIKSNEIKTYKSAKDMLTDRKVDNIEHLTKHIENQKVNIFEVSDFNSPKTKNVNVKYNNLSERTKHYLDMK